MKTNERMLEMNDNEMSQCFIETLLLSRKFSITREFSNFGYTFLAQLEHEVLRVSYCDCAVSTMRVCCASSTFSLVYALEATFSVR